MFASWPCEALSSLRGGRGRGESGGVERWGDWVREVGGDMVGKLWLDVM